MPFPPEFCMKRLSAGLLWAVTLASHAGLGGPPADFGGNALSQRRVQQAQATGSVTYRETVLNTGTVIHEYLGDDGVVYAVTWKGPLLPDLHELLGSHYSALAQPGVPMRQGNGHLQIRRDDLVVETRGQMGAFEGRGWLPPRVPRFLKIDRLK